MNVTFLSSTGTFGGISYNISKVDNNTAEILSIENMPGLSNRGIVKTSDYINYLKAWSARNCRVKNTQFHVAISCKGQEKTKEELFTIGKEWMKKMGYAETPAMYVFHGDTDNNHIHIISSRIDARGKKINDSHEMRKGRTILLNLAKIDLSKNADKDVQEAMEYRFTTEKQFILLLESKGYKVKKDKKEIHLYREGKQVSSVSSEKLEEAIKNAPEVDEKRKAQIKAILVKYKEKGSLSEFVSLMRKKLGFEICFFGEKGKTPYGYAIIDHKGKTVYKGSEIYKLQLLLKDEEKKLTNYNNPLENKIGEKIKILSEEERLGIENINKKIHYAGYFINYAGNIFHYGEECGKLDDNILEKIKYNSRIEKAKKYRISSEKGLYILAHMFNVQAEDLINIGVINEEEKEERKHFLKEMSGGDLFLYLKENNLSIMNMDGQKFLIDNDDLRIDEVEGLEKSEEINNKEFYSGNNQVLNELLGINANNKAAASSENNSPRKKKRR